jgi:8-oxo-dGTP diphosphatase
MKKSSRKEERLMGITTLCYIEKDDSYLMMHRIVKKNDVNKDKWIGVGGHFEHGESPEDCLFREVMEETGLKLTSFRFCGLVTFLSDMGTEKEAWEYMCLYHADGFEGEVKECDEGVLEWVKKEDVMKLNLWEGDKLFLRYMDEGRPFFSLKLEYIKGKLISAYLDGKKLE